MGVIKRILGWLGGANAQKQEPLGNKLDKLYLFAEGREASATELIMVINDPQVSSILKTFDTQKLNAATEQWALRNSEDQGAAMERVAKETSRKHPGRAIYVLIWRERWPSTFIILATEPGIELPLTQSAADPLTVFKVINP